MIHFKRRQNTDGTILLVSELCSIFEAIRRNPGLVGRCPLKVDCGTTFSKIGNGQLRSFGEVD